MPSARDTASTLLAGLDEDVLDYLVTMLEGDEEQEAMEATVAEFLLSTEHVATEEEATAKCRELFAALSCAGAADAAETAAAPEPELKVLEQKTSIAESDSHLFRDVSKDELGGRLVDLDEALEVRRKRKARQEAELRAVRAAHSRVLAQRAAEDAALAAATTAAVELRAKQGAYTGAVEAKPFSLPNPGGGRDLLEKASFTLVRGRIYALIGRNGKGKSTLLRALASRLVGDIPPALTVHYVSQEVQLDEERLGWTPAQVVVHADVERRLLLAEAEELEALELAAAASDEQTGRLQEVRSRLELIEAHTAEERATSLLTNLGFSAELRARRMEALSGGWRVRTALAAAIFARPDLLLLDEPTNHLSIGAVLWLARELSTSPTWQQRMAVVVSHDRVFLDEVATDTLHVSGAARQLTQSRGNYSGWAKRRAQQQLTHEREMESKRRMIAELRAFKPLGSTPKQMKIFKSKEKMADKLEEEARELDEQAASLTEDAELPLSLKAGGEVSGFLVQVKGVSFGYPGSAAPLFSGVEMGIDARSRIVLLGENGNGKTTLVKLLLGDLAPTAGEVVSAGGVRIALVNQHHADQIDLTLTPLQFLMDRFPGDGSYAHEQALRSHLSGCGVTSEMMTLPSSALSGGQRSRVALAAVSYAAPHVLVLDEPTNNLDLESIAALADCVTAFKGGVVLVSHDQYFVSRVANEVWVVEGGQVKRAASFDAFRKQQLTKLQPVD
uniref:ABC transporter domain-containing protein n=1 Tax=Emiliania huxleyi TaxID=2903 RepID=A0A7S3TKC4_EMIHU